MVAISERQVLSFGSGICSSLILLVFDIKCWEWTTNNCYLSFHHRLMAKANRKLHVKLCSCAAIADLDKDNYVSLSCFLGTRSNGKISSAVFCPRVFIDSTFG